MSTPRCATTITRRPEPAPLYVSRFLNDVGGQESNKSVLTTPLQVVSSITDDIKDVELLQFLDACFLQVRCVFVCIWLTGCDEGMKAQPRSLS